MSSAVRSPVVTGVVSIASAAIRAFELARSAETWRRSPMPEHELRRPHQSAGARGVAGPETDYSPRLRCKIRR